MPLCTPFHVVFQDIFQKRNSHAKNYSSAGAGTTTLTARRVLRSYYGLFSVIFYDI